MEVAEALFDLARMFTQPGPTYNVDSKVSESKGEAKASSVREVKSEAKHESRGGGGSGGPQVPNGSTAGGGGGGSVRGSSPGAGSAASPAPSPPGAGAAAAAAVAEGR